MQTIRIQYWNIIMGDRRVLVGRPERKRPFRRLDGRIILKWIF
jgi:hypothetical protein